MPEEVETVRINIILPEDYQDILCLAPVQVDTKRKDKIKKWMERAFRNMERLRLNLGAELDAEAFFGMQKPSDSHPDRIYLSIYSRDKIKLSSFNAVLGSVNFKASARNKNRRPSQEWLFDTSGKELTSDVTSVSRYLFTTKVRYRKIKKKKDSLLNEVPIMRLLDRNLDPPGKFELFRFYKPYVADRQIKSNPILNFFNTGNGGGGQCYSVTTKNKSFSCFETSYCRDRTCRSSFAVTPTANFVNLNPLKYAEDPGESFVRLKPYINRDYLCNCSVDNSQCCAKDLTGKKSKNHRFGADRSSSNGIGMTTVLKITTSRSDKCCRKSAFSKREKKSSSPDYSTELKWDSPRDRILLRDFRGTVDKSDTAINNSIKDSAVDRPRKNNSEEVFEDGCKAIYPCARSVANVCGPYASCSALRRRDNSSLQIKDLLKKSCKGSQRTMNYSEREIEVRSRCNRCRGKEKRLDDVGRKFNDSYNGLCPYSDRGSRAGKRYENLSEDRRTLCKKINENCLKKMFEKKNVRYYRKLYLEEESDCDGEEPEIVKMKFEEGFRKSKAVRGRYRCLLNRNQARNQCSDNATPCADQHKDAYDRYGPDRPDLKDDLPESFNGPSKNKRTEVDSSLRVKSISKTITRQEFKVAPMQYHRLAEPLRNNRDIAPDVIRSLKTLEKLKPRWERIKECLSNEGKYCLKPDRANVINLMNDKTTSRNAIEEFGKERTTRKWNRDENSCRQLPPAQGLNMTSVDSVICDSSETQSDPKIINFCNEPMSDITVRLKPRCTELRNISRSDEISRNILNRLRKEKKFPSRKVPKKYRLFLKDGAPNATALLNLTSETGDSKKSLQEFDVKNRRLKNSLCLSSLSAAAVHEVNFSTGLFSVTKPDRNNKNKTVFSDTDIEAYFSTSDDDTEVTKSSCSAIDLSQLTDNNIIHYNISGNDPSEESKRCFTCVTKDGGEVSLIRTVNDSAQPTRVQTNINAGKIRNKGSVFKMKRNVSRSFDKNKEIIRKCKRAKPFTDKGKQVVFRDTKLCRENIRFTSDKNQKKPAGNALNYCKNAFRKLFANKVNKRKTHP